jgi:hypothetical protein
MLIVSDAVSAVEWYMRALGAGLLWDLGGVAGLHLGPIITLRGGLTNKEASPIHTGIDGRSATGRPSFRFAG